MDPEELDMPNIIFASKPSAGAAVLYLKGLTADATADAKVAVTVS